MLKWLGGLVDSNEKELKRLAPIVNEINSLEPDFQKLTNAELRARTDEFKARLKDGGTLDDLLPEAFAAVREAARRTIGQRHFDVQLIGGIVLHQGKIAEMKTGEGKTLVATLPLYLNALAGKGCHLVTVNDYLARRDAHWMGPIYHALGMTVASIFPQQGPTDYLPAYLYDPGGEPTDKRWPHFRPVTRRQAYEADITYGTNNEFGFDYLRDNMVLDLSQCVQRELNYAIVDEVDNILIDEARTPLIISGTVQDSTEKKKELRERMEFFKKFTLLAEYLKKDKHYLIDEKTREVKLTESGVEEIEKRLGIRLSPKDFPDTVDRTGDIPDFIQKWVNEFNDFTHKEREGRQLNDEEKERKEKLEKIIYWNNELKKAEAHIINAIKAKELFIENRDYVVKDGKVIIVDEFTGRLMFGRRYSDELHEALESKEEVRPQLRSVTLATITFQNYFRLYGKLAGMTGTAVTEAEEFHKIYKLEVVIAPTNKPMIRIDNPDQIYKDEESKFKAVANEIESFYKQGSPVLIGTVSIEKSEKLSELLQRRGVSHQLLNAKNHTREADIIAQAGKAGAVTVSTNMAGRGVDIILGGNPFRGDAALSDKELQEWQAEHDKVVAMGGLHVIGTERHEARRIDNQLRGRSGRQGDPGSSRFYVSLEDDIVRRFGGDRIKGVMEWAGMDENTPIEHPMVNKAIENAQVRVEGYHFDMRKHLVEYDDIVNKHREVIYAERRKILSGADLKANILSMVEKELQSLVAARCSSEFMELDVFGLSEDIADIFPPPLPSELSARSLSAMKSNKISDTLIGYAEHLYGQQEKEMPPGNMRLLERLIMLRTIDTWWTDHLTNMDYLRQSVGLESVRQIDPLVAYKREGGNYFDSLVAGIQHDVVHTIYNPKKRDKILDTMGIKIQFAHEPPAQRQPPKAAVPTGKGKVGRNDPCPCGSGKKYKHCCGK